MARMMHARLLRHLLARLLVVLVAAIGIAAQRVHVVAPGQTLGGIARRYNTSTSDLRAINHLALGARLRSGQKLLIPDAKPARDGDAKARPGCTSAAHELDLPGKSPVYCYPPLGPGRLAMRPVVVYLHGRGGDAKQACSEWAPIAQRFGWLICPSGPVEHGEGKSWNNHWSYGHDRVMAAIDALRERFGRRVQRWGNTLIGFSEGAFVAMNIGVREPRVFNRWLILGADADYWGEPEIEALREASRRVRRVMLITGARDEVVDSTQRVAQWLRDAKIRTRVETPDDLAHELALDRMPKLYERSLRWLVRGS